MGYQKQVNFPKSDESDFAAFLAELYMSLPFRTRLKHSIQKSLFGKDSEMIQNIKKELKSFALDIKKDIIPLLQQRKPSGIKARL